MVNSFHFQVPIGPVKAFKQRKLLVPIQYPLTIEPGWLTVVQRRVNFPARPDYM